MNYKIVFDLEQQPGLPTGFTPMDLLTLIPGLILFLLSLWMLTNRKRLIALWQKRIEKLSATPPTTYADWLARMPPPQNFMFFLFSAWTALVLLMPIGGEVSDYIRLRDFMGKSQVEEGEVYHSASRDGSKMFCVQKVCFFFHSDKEVFNRGLEIAKTLPDGVPARVTYSDGIIVRLEVGS